MTRYINADMLYASIAKDTYVLTDGINSKDYGMYLIGIKEKIDEAPTADVVEVVRCKDCRYFKKIVERSDSGLCHKDIVASAWKENGYCSRGERKGGDSE